MTKREELASNPDFIRQVKAGLTGVALEARWVCDIYSRGTVLLAKKAVMETNTLELTTRLTPADVEAEINAFHSGAHTIRHSLLRLHDGKAHEVLRFASFEAFCVERLHVRSGQYVNQMLAWARIELQLSRDLDQPVVITQDVAGALSPLSERPNDLARVYAEMKDFEATGKTNTSAFVSNLKKRVSGMVPPKLNKPKEPPTPAPTLPPAAPETQAPAPELPDEAEREYSDTDEEEDDNPFQKENEQFWASQPDPLVFEFESVKRLHEFLTVRFLLQNGELRSTLVPLEAVKEAMQE